MVRAPSRWPHHDVVAAIEVLVRGPLAESIASLIASRFGPLAISPAGPERTRIAGEMDQSSERALLALLWDTGHDVLSMRFTLTEND